jgi:hypothetical protein
VQQRAADAFAPIDRRRCQRAPGHRTFMLS